LKALELTHVSHGWGTDGCGFSFIDRHQWKAYIQN